MFTGIVEEMGSVRRVGSRTTVEARVVAGDSAPGASLAVSGVCLTIVERHRPEGGEDPTGVLLSFDLSPETLARTTIGRLRLGDPVNLERPVAADGRLGGHIVQGHVDGVGSIERIDPVDTGAEMTVRVAGDLARYVAEKGSVTLDGVSLTVTRSGGDTFGVALVPYTLEATTFGHARPGDGVNVEVDVIARYVERLLRAGADYEGAGGRP